MRIFVFALVCSMFANPSSAQTGDYLSFNEVAGEAARIATSIQSCKHLGFDVIDRKSMGNELSDAVIRRGIMLGIDSETAGAIFTGSIRDERRDMDLLHKMPSDVKNRDDLIRYVHEIADFWSDRCLSLSEGEFGSKYIRKTGNEDQAKEKFISDNINLIDDAIKKRIGK